MMQRMVRLAGEVAVNAATGYAAVKLTELMVDNEGARKRIEIAPRGNRLVARVKLGMFKSTEYSVPLKTPQALNQLMRVLRQKGYTTETVEELRVRLHPAA